MTKSAFELLSTVQYHMLTHSRTEASYFSHLLEVIEKKKQKTKKTNPLNFDWKKKILWKFLW